MSGYRQSSFDPAAFAEPGPPLRPYNWVQRLGMALAVVGTLMTVARAAGDFGWIEPMPILSFPGTIPLLVGVLLVNSRRGPSTDITPKRAAARKRAHVVILAVSALFLGAAVLIAFSGA